MPEEGDEHVAMNDFEGVDWAEDESAARYCNTESIDNWVVSQGGRQGDGEEE